MTFTKLHANRLRKLITHLLRGKLSKSKFDFQHVNSEPGNVCAMDNCGTAGCALGEFHAVFPSHFRGRFYVGVEDATDFLGICKDESLHLFVPNHQFLGRSSLPVDATRFEVAANMIAFLRSKGYSYAD